MTNAQTINQKTEMDRLWFVVVHNHIDPVVTIVDWGLPV